MEIRRSSTETKPTDETNRNPATTEGRRKRQFSAETKAKLSAAHKGEKNPMYGKKGEKHPMYGKKHSAEARAKMSEAKKGRKHPMYGKKHSAEARAKMSEAKKGKKHSAEHRAKISEAMKGENHPMYGKKHSAETRAKMSEARKMSETRKANWNKSIEQVRWAITCVIEGDSMSKASLDMGFHSDWLSGWKYRHPQRYSAIFLEETKKLSRWQAGEKLGALALDITTRDQALDSTTSEEL